LTGLGGRLDAANLTDPLLSLINPVSFDHQE
jgi:folylpolyglutamate synthase/dihydropteroate synthase